MSGFVDIDAIALSSLSLFNGGKAGATIVDAVIGLAFVAAVAFKLAMLLIVGGGELFKRWAPALLAPVAGIAVGLLLFA